MTAPNEPENAPSSEPAGPVIPDFEKDAAAVASYQEARLRYERRESQDAESKTRAQFAKRREAIRAEIAVAASLLEQRIEKAQQALGQYAKRYPKRMDRSKALKPSFWESVLSFGAASRFYRNVIRTQADAQDIQSLRRRKEHDEEELEQQLRRLMLPPGQHLPKRVYYA